MTTNAIAGNQYFSTVNNFAAPISSINASRVSAGELVAGIVKQTSRGTETTVVGYTPSEWSSAAIGSTYSLVKSAGMHAASATSLDGLLQIPSGAIVTKVVAVCPEGTLATGTYSLGLSSLSSSNAPNQSISTSLMAATNTSAGFNSAEGVQVGGVTLEAAPPALGAAGQDANNFERPGQVVPSGQNFVSVLNSAVPVGSLRVSVTYTNN
jgi:hypothetical protein